jgi:superfamily I DNA/RNA helicase/DNA polymerase III epsilon subunit-like protein
MCFDRAPALDCAYLPATNIDPVPELAGYRMPGLSDSQRRIVEFGRFDRHMLVIAPPGSGKTHTIAQRIAWLLEGGHAQPEEILALTYTNKAGRELKDRIAGNASPHVRASTLHSWAYDFLRKHGPEIGIPESFQVCDDFRREDLIRTAAATAGIPMLGLDQVRKAGYWLGERKRDPNRPPVQRPPFNETIMSALEAAYQMLMRESELLDFDDLIVMAADLIWQNEDVRLPLHEKVRFVFVDEYHDLSREQYRLLTAIAPGSLPGRQVLTVADPNQAIFGFRGGDADEMLHRFRTDYRPDSFELDRNFRSTARLVHSSNTLIERGQGRVVSIPDRPGTDAPFVRHLVSDVEEAEWITRAIAAGVNKGREYRDFAVIYRRHKRADLLEHHLLANDIPVARVQPNRFFDDRTVIEGFRYLQLIAALDDRRFEPAVNWPRVLVDELTMMQLRTAARQNGIRLTELATNSELLRATVTPLSALGIERFMRALVVEAGSIDDARQGVERMLPLVRSRRDPVPQRERANFRSTLFELAKAVDSVADTLHEAIREGIAIRLCFDEDNPDHVLGASILKRTIEQGFGNVVVLRESAPHPSVEFSFHDLEKRAGQFTCAALIYRLCQRLDEHFDRSRHQRFVMFDVEATGTHIGTAELLQIGAVVVENGKITGDPFATFVRPSGPEVVTEEVSRLTNIGWRDVADAPSAPEALRAFLEFVGEAPLVGHNIDGYDLPLVRRICREHGIPEPGRYSIDTMKIWKRLHPGESWSLDAALTPEEKRMRRAHRADLDARLNARVFIDLMREIGRERRATLLNDELPLVAASIAVRGSTDPDNQLLLMSGRRAIELGQGIAPSLAADCLQLPGALDIAASAIARTELVTDAEDATWERIEQQWLESVANYERTHTDRSLQGFVRWFELAVSTDIEHADENRVAMMSIHAAKGREWPVVIMLGAEDDQYVFPAEPDEDEARRHFYVGITRARDVLIITNARQVGDEERRPSRFLADLALPD